MLHKVKPAVVIVEEAAEILEPCLLAALGPHVKKLILIGDHQQLRPQVDNFDLKKKYHFDVSMMERLIGSGFPYKVLSKQNRMRPEISALLKDIYPNLEDNLEKVKENEKLACLGKSMFFWNHSYPEDKHTNPNRRSRSWTNAKEADMVVSLSHYLLSCGVSTNRITIITSYKGQQALLRKRLRDLHRRHFFHLADFVQVQTIDMFQGDENDVIIVSLVRSNPEGKIGFIASMNRRCVAQSRAKSCLIFIGNGETLVGSNSGKQVWQPLLEKMKEKNCFGNSFQLQCPTHDENLKLTVTSPKDLECLIANPIQICNLPCGKLFDCNIPEHACKRACIPSHEHVNCLVDITGETYRTCGHPMTRKCFQKPDEMKCNETVSFKFPYCHHSGKKRCCDEIQSQICVSYCPKKMDCQLHDCTKMCGAPHEHSGCLEEVAFAHPCGHNDIKPCSKSESDLKCGKPISYNISTCGHPAMRTKICSNPNEEKCTKLIGLTFRRCRHESHYPCGSPQDQIKCPVQPCLRIRSCGHPCGNKCGESCEKGNCKVCTGERYLGIK